jgi:hypothetical protein
MFIDGTDDEVFRQRRRRGLVYASPINMSLLRSEEVSLAHGKAEAFSGVD